MKQESTMRIRSRGEQGRKASLEITDRSYCKEKSTIGLRVRDGGGREVRRSGMDTASKKRER